MEQGQKFEVGKTYWTRSIGDSDCIFTITVLARTAQTITVGHKYHAGQTQRLKIKDSYDGHECVMPYGRYSMAPTITAAKVRS